MDDGTNQLPDQPIDEAELPAERVAPSAGQAAVIAGGADASGGAAIDDDLADPI